MSHIQNICTLNDLRKLEVINLCDGKRLGCVVDLEFDLCLGNILAIPLPRKGDFGDLFRKCDKKYIRVPWCNIERIGDDTILVRIEPDQCF